MDTERKKTILSWFGITYDAQQNSDWHHSYFDFIKRDLGNERGRGMTPDEVFRLASQAVDLVLRTTSDTNNDDCPRPGTKTEIMMRMKESNRQCQDLDLENAIHRAVRLIFRINSMIDSRTAHVAPHWPDDKTVSEYTRSVFNAGSISSSSGVCSEPDDSEIAGIQARLTHRLTVVNIEKYTKIKIKETQYLPWHLKLYETYDYTTLYMFRDMRWLLDAVKIDNFPVPKEVIQETIDTLNYLYPKDRATARLLEREGTNMHDCQNSIPDRPRFRDFKYYRPRMADVAYEFLNPPRTWKTIWKDRRNPMQFWTFWLGLLIFFFTIGFGVAATVLAIWQLDVARHPPESG